ncbi:MAG: phosphoenolpyruvate carboxykinase (GTP), partial [Candidatus Aureabacteria bacterium]|nr:phosphoenolpyruvate carboxykinase (GTP) [Candidatus Auribacterota bacterium]
MSHHYLNLLKGKMSPGQFKKLAALENQDAVDFIGKYVELCNPDDVFVRTDLPEDIEHIRFQALELGEEKSLSQEGHTVHFDGYHDQARDKKNTRYLLPRGAAESQFLNSIDKEKGLEEIQKLLENIMQGKKMFVCFFCLGPLNSPFSLPAVQITDSSYVAHSEDILYRPGYGQFKNMKGASFFKFVHSAGKLENCVSKNTEKRRIYMDLEDNTVYSVNTQYAGNTVGLKKLSLRLAIKKASEEGWLAEHMFIMGVHDRKGEKAYFCGAFPSMCGKTSTAMVLGETIVGDDIAYLKEKDGKAYAANVEWGIFGIIKDVSSKSDPVLFKALESPGEIIFSNILVDKNNVPYWLGKNGTAPHKGYNYSGEWYPGKTDNQGNEIPASHKNARYTIRLSCLENVDDKLESPEGVEVKGLIYGGRDSDTSVPVEESFSWEHGIVTKAANLESETTAATLGQEGVRVFNPMSNMDFLSVPLGKYIQMNLEFSKGLKTVPSIFSVNYFL